MKRWFRFAALFAMVPLAVLASAWAVPGHTQGPTAGGSHAGTLVLASDIAEPLAFQSVVIEKVGDPAWGYQTDVAGATPAFSLTPGIPLIVTVEESPNPIGYAIGQKFVVFPPQVDPDVILEYQHVRYAPTSRNVSISSTVISNDVGNHTLWQFQPGQNAFPAVEFQASVGLLNNSEEITAYESYHGVQINPQAGEYRIALCIRAAPVDLGVDKLMLILDCRSYEFQGQPSANCFHVSPSSSGPNATLSATPIAWQDEQLVLAISGKLGRGDNLILINPEVSVPAVPARQISQPGGGTVVLGSTAVVDCVPVAPGAPPGWSCEPVAVSSGCPTTSGPTTCKTLTLPVGSVTCGKGGDTVSRRETVQVSGSITIELEASGFVSAQAEHKISGEVSNDIQYVVPDGAGCGQCRRAFSHYLFCARSEQVMLSKYVQSFSEAHLEIPCHYSRSVKAVCNDQIVTEGSCDRTGCGN